MDPSRRRRQRISKFLDANRRRTRPSHKYLRESVHAILICAGVLPDLDDASWAHVLDSAGDGIAGTCSQSLNRQLARLLWSDIPFWKEFFQPFEKCCSIIDANEEILALCGCYIEIVCALPISKEREERGKRKGQVTSRENDAVNAEICLTVECLQNCSMNETTVAVSHVRRNKLSSIQPLTSLRT